MGERRRFEPAVFLAALLVVAGLGPTISAIRGAAAVDFYHFWLVGQVVRSGEAVDVYSPIARDTIGARAFRRARAAGVGGAQARAATKFRRLETTATPFLYASFFPFVRGDYDYDRIAFNAASTALFVLALGALAWRLGYGTSGVLLLIGLVLIAFEPLQSDLRVGNVNRLQFVLLVAYAWLLWDPRSGERWRPGLAGAWMGLGVAWKPNLALPVAAVVVDGWLRGERRATVSHLVGLAVGGALGFVAAAAFFGTTSVWLWWAEAAAHLSRDFPIPIEEGNFAPTRVLEQAFSVHFGAAWPAAWIVLLGLVLRRGAIERANAPIEGRVILVIGLSCGVSLLASPLSWLHYYLLAVPLVVWVLRPDPRPGAPLAALPWLYRGLGVMAVAAVSMGPILRLFVSSSPYRWAAFGNGGIAVLLGLGAFDLLRASAHDRSVPVGTAAASRDEASGALASGLAIRDGSVCPPMALSSPPTKRGSSWRWPTVKSAPSTRLPGLPGWKRHRFARRSKA